LFFFFFFLFGGEGWGGGGWGRWLGGGGGGGKEISVAIAFPLVSNILFRKCKKTMQTVKINLMCIGPCIILINEE